MDRARPLVEGRRAGRLGIAALVAVPVGFLGYFFAYPVVAITLRGLTADGSLDGSVFADVVGDPSMRAVAWFTFWQAFLSTVITVVVALPAAWVFARFTFPGKRILEAATLVPFVLPTLVVGSAFLTLAGPRGVLGVDMTGTLGIILIAHVFYNYAIVVRGVGAYWQRIDPRLEAAARTLGASPFKAFTSVTLRLLLPAIASAAALVFLFSFTSFGVVLLLGDLKHTTVEVEIWRQTTAFLRLDVASVLAVLQLVGVAGILAAYGWFQRRTRVAFEHSVETVRRPRGPQRWIVTGIVATTFALLGVPIAVLAARSFVGPTGAIGLENYANLFSLPDTSGAFVDPTSAIENSLVFAFVATALALFIGLIASAAVTYTRRRTARVIDVFVMLPLAASAVTIGFGFLVALDRPVDIRTSVLLIPIAHALVAIPFVVRTAAPALAAIGRNLHEAAATLGADPWRTWWTIDVRLTATAVMVAGAFAFAISMGEFGATAFIVRPGSPTIPIAIFKLLGKPGPTPFGAAIALSSILMVITGLSILVIDALGVRSRSDL